jgi:hypothetical protein
MSAVQGSSFNRSLGRPGFIAEQQTLKIGDQWQQTELFLSQKEVSFLISSDDRPCPPAPIIENSILVLGLL